MEEDGGPNTGLSGKGDAHCILKSIWTRLTTLRPDVFDLRVNHLCRHHTFLLSFAEQRTSGADLFKSQRRALNEASGLA